MGDGTGVGVSVGDDAGVGVDVGGNGVGVGVGVSVWLWVPVSRVTAGDQAGNVSERVLLVSRVWPVPSALGVYLMVAVAAGCERDPRALSGDQAGIQIRVENGW